MRDIWHALEWNEQRDALVRNLTSMILSWDQNGHLFMHRDDISQLVHAVELLKRCQLKE